MKHIYNCEFTKERNGLYRVMSFQDDIEVREDFLLNYYEKNQYVKRWISQGVKNSDSFYFQYLPRFSYIKEFDDFYDVVLRCDNSICMTIALAKSFFVNPEFVARFWDKYGNIVISVAKDSEKEKTREYSALVSKTRSHFDVILKVDDEFVGLLSVDDCTFAESISACWKKYHRICIESVEIDDYGFYIPGLDDPTEEDSDE